MAYCVTDFYLLLLPLSHTHVCALRSAYTFSLSVGLKHFPRLTGTVQHFAFKGLFSWEPVIGESERETLRDPLNHKKIMKRNFEWF